MLSYYVMLYIALSGSFLHTILLAYGACRLPPTYICSSFFMSLHFTVLLHLYLLLNLDQYHYNPQYLSMIAKRSHNLTLAMRKMAKYGFLGWFNLTDGDWKSYVERAKQYFAANEITSDTKQWAVLLSACGNNTYHRIKDACLASSGTKRYLSEDDHQQDDQTSPTHPV